MDENQTKAVPVEIGKAEFEAQVLKSKQPVLVAFCASWSRPCHVLAPVLDAVAETCCPGVKVFTVNADDNPDLSLWYDVQSVPTLLYFVEGNLSCRIVGTATREAILSKLQSASAHADQAGKGSI